MTETATKRKRATKSVFVPSEGDFLTDGTRLVEVIGQERTGYRIRDARTDLDSDAPEVLGVFEVARSWSLVVWVPTETGKVTV